MSQRRAGILFFKVNGNSYDAKGNFSYNLGKEKRETIVGADRIHGYKSMVQPAFIEGEITDSSVLSLEDLVLIDEATITLELSNGKVIVLRDSWFAGEGTGQTEEGNIAVRFEGASGEEIR